MKHINKFDDFINEAIGDERDLKHYAKIFFGLLLSPIVVPLWANLPTEKKIEFLSNTAIENYYAEKAEYEILDDKKYDVEVPSKLNRIKKRLRLIEKRQKQCPTIDKYLSSGFKFLKLSNIFNFKNREDVNYIIKKVNDKIHSKSEEQWVKELKELMVYDEDKAKVVYEGEVRRLIRELTDGY